MVVENFRHVIFPKSDLFQGSSLQKTQLQLQKLPKHTENHVKIGHLFRAETAPRRFRADTGRCGIENKKPKLAFLDDEREYVNGGDAEKETSLKAHV